MLEIIKPTKALTEPVKDSERDLMVSVRSRQPACLLSYIKKTGAMPSSFRFRQSGPLSSDQETLQPIRDGGGKKVSLGSLLSLVPLIPEHQQILKTDYICEYMHFFHLSHL